MSDKRDVELTVEEYRELIVPSYQSVTAKIMAHYQNQIRVHSFNTKKVISKKDLLDTKSIVPTVFNVEASEVNHAKFFPVGDTFTAVGMYQGFRVSQMQEGSSRQSNHNAIMRELTIAWDSANLVGNFGNKGLLKHYPDDPLRVKIDDATLPKRDAAFEVRAKAAKDLGSKMKSKIDATSASEDLMLLVYGEKLQEYMTDTNSATDVATLYGYLLKGFGTKRVEIVEVPALALRNTDLANECGFTLISNGTQEMDTTGYPDLDKVGTSESENGDYDWSRFKVGSVQTQTNTEGGIINQKVKFAS